MASGISIYYANLSLNKLLRAEDFTPTASYWVAAFTNTGAAGFLRSNNLASAQEVSTSGTGYTRIEVRGSTGISWAAASGGTTNQNTAIVWNAATGAWGTVYTIALIDAASGGNCVCYGDISPARTITTPDVLRIPVNTFIVNL